MYQYRVTKYNPVFRDEKGRYTREEWTSFGEVGEIVPVKEYIRVEAAYIEAALDFLREADVVELQIRGLENSKNLPTLLVEGVDLKVSQPSYILAGIIICTLAFPKIAQKRVPLPRSWDSLSRNSNRPT
jgi:hypothetical protein